MLSRGGGGGGGRGALFSLPVQMYMKNYCTTLVLTSSVVGVGVGGGALFSLPVQMYMKSYCTTLGIGVDLAVLWGVGETFAALAMVLTKMLKCYV